MRQTESRRQIEPIIQYSQRRNGEREDGSEHLHVLVELRLRELALRQPIPQLVDRLGEHLPKQDSRLRTGREPLDQGARLGLLGGLIVIHCVKQNVRVNGVHAIGRASGVPNVAACFSTTPPRQPAFVPFALPLFLNFRFGQFNGDMHLRVLRQIQRLRGFKTPSSKVAVIVCVIPVAPVLLCRFCSLSSRSAMAAFQSSSLPNWSALSMPRFLAEAVLAFMAAGSRLAHLAVLVQRLLVIIQIEADLQFVAEQLLHLVKPDHDIALLAEHEFERAFFRMANDEGRIGPAEKDPLPFADVADFSRLQVVGSRSKPRLSALM